MALGLGSLVQIEKNPDLGPGRIMPGATGDDEVQILYDGPTFPIRRETGLIPYPMPAGLQVQVFIAAGAYAFGTVVEEVSKAVGGEHRHFLVTVGDEELTFDELSIQPRQPDRTDIVSRLSCLDWDRPTQFLARRNLLRSMKLWYEDSEGVPTLTGARIHPYGHQIYAVQRVLWSRTPRFVLADEVGLGKTIEAGLVVQALMASDPNLSVLIVAPGAMTRQWLCEIYLRFGGRAFSIVKDLKGEVSNRAIVSTTTLSRQPKHWKALTDRHWGMVIIDEAHQSPPGHPLYDLYRELSRTSDGILVLSATPSKREANGLLGLLALVAPDQYNPDEPASFEKLLELRRDVWDLLGYHQQLREGEDFKEFVADKENLVSIADEWEALIGEDPVAAKLITSLRAGDASSFDTLEVYVQEHYRVDHRIIRTRRRTVESMGQSWCKREVETLHYEASSEEVLLSEHFEERLPAVANLDGARRALSVVYLRLLTSTPERCLERLVARRDVIQSKEATSEDARWWAELLSDPSPEEDELLSDQILANVAPFEGELKWLGHAIELAKVWAEQGAMGARHLAAMAWIAEYLESHDGEKLLVFSEDRSVVKAFASALATAIGKKVEPFHWVDSAAEEEKLQETAHRFQRHKAYPVLVSDELGGEGRNFQMAAAVVHLDSPWAVAKLEQRIGRLDRMGRDESRPVRSVVLVGKGPLERCMHQIHSQVFRVFEQSIGGLEFLLPELQKQIFESASSGTAILRSRLDEFSETVRTALKDAEDDFDVALDTSRLEMEAAQELVDDWLIEIDGVDRMDPITYWARALGMNARIRDLDTPHESFRFKWNDENLQTVLRGVPVSITGNHRVSGTFDRHRALTDESIHFFAPGHHLIDALLDALNTSYVGRLSVFGRKLPAKYRRRFFLNVLVSYDLDPTLWTDEPFAAGLLTRARRRLFPETIERCYEIELGGTTRVTPVEDRELSEALEADYQGRETDIGVAGKYFTGLGLPGLAAGLAKGVQAALRDTEVERRNYAREARTELSEDIMPEIGFLKGQIQRGQGSVELLKVQLRQRELLLRHLTDSRATLAGAAIILGM